jgi:DNA-binding MurR/RpiR family transcriptional regulator
VTLALLIETRRADLTANQQRIADFVLANPFHVATMGIEDLAKATETSPATMTRFVRALGCGSFAEFRGFAVQGYQSLLRPVENVDRARQISPQQIVEDSLANAANAVQQLSATSREINWEEIAARMVSAPRVGFLGFGVSANMLQYLADKTVSVVRSQVILNGTGGLERDAQKMLRFGPEDMVIAMALPRYSQATLDFLKIARGRGVHCVVVTDSASSPLCALGHETILVPASHPVLHSSPIAALAVFETLIAVITAHHQSVSDAVSVARYLMPYLYADDESQPQSKSGNTNVNEVE